MPIVLDGSLGVTTPMYNGSIAANAVTPSVNMKNRIINGAMQISQRGTSFAGLTNTSTYTLDRWQLGQSGSGVATVSQSSDTPASSGFVNSSLVTVTTAQPSLGSGNFYQFQQRIEGFNTADLRIGTSSAATVTLSFWVKSSVTGTYSVAFNREAASTYRSYISTYTINSANTWEQKSITLTLDTSVSPSATELTNGIGLYVGFQLGTGSTFTTSTLNTWQSAVFVASTSQTNLFATNSSTWQITGVQLEVGSTATSFDYRPYTTELQLCQRYLPAFTGANGATTGAIGTGGFFSTVDAAIGIPFPVPTRVAPTGISVSSASHFQIDGLTSAACTSATFSSTSQNMGGINFGYATSTTSGSFARLRFNNASGLLLFTGCEL